VKPARRRTQARTDILDTARYYREAAGAAVSQRFAQAVKDAVEQLESNPAIGSPRIGQELGVPELRTWRLAGFPAALWYFERADHVDIVRLVGERQDPLIVSVPTAPEKS
jgi:toxin ParE1/3/4